MKTRRNFLICSVVFAFVAATILVTAFFLYIDAKKIEQNSERVIGTITEIQVRETRIGTGRRRRSSTEHNVFVSYSVKGVEYNNVEIGYYDNTMREGGSIELLYDKTNPANVRSERGLFFGAILFAGLGALFMVIALIITVCFFPRRQRLKKTGVRYEAAVSNIHFIQNVIVNGRHPYRVECVFVDPATGIEKHYKSNNIYQDLEKYELQTVPIYIHPEFPSKYYIDVDEAIEKINLNKQKESRSVYY